MALSQALARLIWVADAPASIVKVPLPTPSVDAVSSTISQTASWNATLSSFVCTAPAFVYSLPSRSAWRAVKPFTLPLATSE